MKLLVVCMILLVLAGCGRTTGDGETGYDYNNGEPLETASATGVVPVTEPVPAPTAEPTAEPVHTPTPHPLQSVEHPLPLGHVARIFDEIRELFDEDGGDLWGFELHAPIMFVDPTTRAMAANTPDLHGHLQEMYGIFLGYYPEELTLFSQVVTWEEFGGLLWVVVPWPAISDMNREGRVSLLSHKVMHWQQFSGLFEEMMGWNNSHMNEEFARISVRLEINALIRALRTMDEERLEAITDALSIRAERRSIFGHESDENRLELIEGLAQYNEWIFLTYSRNRAPIGRIRDNAHGMIHGDSMEHSFGYVTGALYAFLLLESGESWTPYLTMESDLAQMLMEIKGITQLRPFEDIDLRQYDYNAISAEERSWVESRVAVLQGILNALENYPQLRFYDGDYDHHGGAMSGHRFTFAELGTVFRGGFDLFGSFGHLNIRNSTIIMHNDGYIVIVANGMEVSDRRVTTRNWVLELNEGYEVIPHGDNFRIARE